MPLLLVFSLTLVTGILISDRAARTVLSTSVLFLVAGAVTGSLAPDFLLPQERLVEPLAEAALFSVLLTDGMQLSLQSLRSEFYRPGRALAFGLPLTLLGTAALAHWIAGLTWTESMLLGAVLSPTDPVLVSAIVGDERVPWSIRHLLNVESGLNDGLALPVVIVLLSLLRDEPVEPLIFGAELAGGVLSGIAIPWLILRFERVRYFGVSRSYAPLIPVAVGLLVFALANELHLNAYLAAFAAGVTIASIASDAKHRFQELGEPITEILKLAALLVFGGIFSASFLSEVEPSGYLFAALALLLVRPVALALSMIGRPLPRGEFLAVAWFGPKGFASVVYSMIVLSSGIGHSQRIFHLAAITIAISIVAHSSTDVMVARQLVKKMDGGKPVLASGEWDRK